jgi:peptidoglycan/LPS O-acetylase OafA/YrhL
MQWGKIGVVTFFILSGYLIVSILLKTRNDIENGASLISAWGDFYKRRALRIFPIYYGLIFVLYIAGTRSTIDTFWWHITFTSNIGSSLFGIDYKYLAHLWSICIEEQFYLVVPIVILCNPINKSFKALCYAFLICMAIKLTLATTRPSDIFISRMAITNVEGISYGALIAYSFYHAPAYKILSFTLRWITPFAVAGMLAFSAYRFNVRTAAYNTFLYSGASDIFIAVSFGAIACAVISNKYPLFFNKFIGGPILVFMGTISYGTYLYHYALFPYYGSMLDYLSIDASGMTATAFKFLVAYAIASLSWFLFEKPILGLKKFIPSRRAEISQANKVLTEHGETK